MDDLPRIGPEPDCDYPGCRLLGRVRILARGALAERYVVVCSLHTDWDGADECKTRRA